MLSALRQRRQRFSLSAAEPAQALRIASTYEGMIDVLLTDVVMPGMTGYKLASELRLAGLKVLYMSGYTDRTITSREAPKFVSLFLQKPFALNTLAGTIQDLLARDGQDHGVRNQVMAQESTEWVGIK